MKKIFKILISCLTCFVLVLSLGFSGCSCSVKESDTDDQTESIDRDVEYEVYDYTYDSEKSGYENGVYTITSTCEGKDDAVMTISGLSDEGDITVQTSPVKVTFTKIGTYTLTGELYGSIEVAIAEEVEDDVEIELSAATITSYTTSPFYVSTENQDDVKISAKKNTTNNVCDYRSVTDDDLDSAIYAVGDLKFKGKGTLNVLSAYNNGIHTKDDLEVKNLTLYVNCVDNALKGNDSVTILSGTLTLLSAEGDGIKTSNSSYNTETAKQKGIITIQPEENAAEINIDIYAYSDGIDAAYDVVIDENGIDSKGNDVSGTITINIYTYSYASSKLNAVQTVIQSAGPGGFGGGMPGGFNGGMGQGGGGQGPSEDGNTDKLDISAKGIKADNEITISGGTFVISAYDDAIHANNDEELENSETPLGNVIIAGGTFTIMTHDDGIHADGTLEITDGEITIGTLTNNTVYEGLEGNVINIKGGKAVVIAKDDGVNAKSGSKTPAINVSGGLLDVTVPSSGDIDGIDSNGTYTQTGGVVITRGPNSETSAAIDADSTKVIYGGTLIILGYGSVQRGSGVNSYSLSLHSSGSKTVNIGGTSYSFTNGNYSYGRTIVYSSVAVS